MKDFAKEYPRLRKEKIERDYKIKIPNKMLKVQLGKKAHKDFAYSVEDVGSKKTSYHGSKAGIKKLTAKSKALEGMKDNLPRKTVTSKQHSKIMREQGTSNYNK
jgi:hypothetical protein